MLELDRVEASVYRKSHITAWGAEGTISVYKYKPIELASVPLIVVWLAWAKSQMSGPSWCGRNPYSEADTGVGACVEGAHSGAKTVLVLL